MGDQSFTAPREASHLLADEEVFDGSTDSDDFAPSGPGGEQGDALLVPTAGTAYTVGTATPAASVIIGRCARVPFWMVGDSATSVKIQGS